MEQDRIGIDEYSQSHSSPLNNLLGELERETNLKTLAPQMIAGPLQGKLLRMLSKMIQPRLILEIGTFTGYSTLCLAEGLPETGSIYTIEINKELKHISDKYFRKSRYKDQIKAIEGDAVDILHEIDETFDLIFIDAAKRDNAKFYKLSIELLKEGGVILVDNVLWDGKVLNESKKKTEKLIDDFNKMVLEDSRVENVILPIRDGLNIIRKVVT